MVFYLSHKCAVRRNDIPHMMCSELQRVICTSIYISLYTYRLKSQIKEFTLWPLYTMYTLKSFKGPDGFINLPHNQIMEIMELSHYILWNGSNRLLQTFFICIFWAPETYSQHRDLFLNNYMVVSGLFSILLSWKKLVKGIVNIFPFSVRNFRY